MAGFLAPIIAGIGGLFTKGAVTTGAKAVLGGVASGLIGSAFDRKKQSDSYNYLEGKGLTPQEIAGSGAAGQGSSGVGQVLGNQFNQLQSQRIEQAFAERERDKDRALQIRAQDTGLRQSQISAGAQIYGANTQAQIAAGQLDLQRDRYSNIEMPQALREAITNSPSWKRTQILASMGVDNILGTSIAQRFGVNPMDSNAVKAMSQAEFLQMARTIYGMQSNAFGETSGAAIQLQGASQALPSMGNQGGGSSVRR